MQEFGKWKRLHLVQFIQYIERGFLSHPLDALEFCLLESEEVRYSRDKFSIEELLDQFFTYAVHLESPAPIQNRSTGPRLAHQITAAKKSPFNF